jgi:formamidopyrimidine-DNA glycosylase
MPELPEVETITRELARSLTGEKILSARIRYPKVIGKLKSREFEKLVRGAAFKKFQRRAKVIVMELSNGRAILVHLKLTGRLLLEAPGVKPRKETETVFRLKSGRQLFYDDLRRFGWIKLLPISELKNYFQRENYGPEPLAPSFTAQKMIACLRARPRKKIKQVLLDQTCIAGVGNIYADESLWSAGILPPRLVSEIDDQKLRRLCNSLKLVLRRAILFRGSSASDYLDLYGQPGDFFPKLRAYGQTGKKCAKGDRGIIKKIKLAGRGTHYCPVQQK